MSHVLLLGQMLCSGFSLHLRWPLLLLSFYKHLDTWDSFLSSFAVQPSISVFKLYLSHTSIQKKKKKADTVTIPQLCSTAELTTEIWTACELKYPFYPLPRYAKPSFGECTLAQPHPRTLPFLPYVCWECRHLGHWNRKWCRKNSHNAPSQVSFS